MAELDAHEGPVYFADEDALYFTSVPRPGADRSPSVQIKRLPLSELDRVLGGHSMSAQLQPGMTVPDFELPDENGDMHRLSELQRSTWATGSSAAPPPTSCGRTSKTSSAE